MRAISYTVHGLIPASCVFADRYNREEVVRSLGKEVNINPPLMLGQLPDTPEELLKLDQVGSVLPLHQTGKRNLGSMKFFSIQNYFFHFCNKIKICSFSQKQTAFVSSRFSRSNAVLLTSMHVSF